MLLPVLVHRMNNTTQLLSNLHALIGVDRTRDWLGERSEDLGQSAADTDEMGYLLAVLSSAAGADMLLSRRVARGLEILMSAVGEVARRSGRDLVCEQPIPHLAPEVHDGWQLPWAFAALICQAVLDLPEGEKLHWQLLGEADAWVLICPRTPSCGYDGLRQQVGVLLPETTLDIRDGGWSWRFPASWLREPS